MGRAVTNADVNGRIRQFVVLFFITVIGTILSIAFLGAGAHKSKTESSTQPINATQTIPAQASFK